MKITANKCWADIDELDGTRLKDGEQLLVSFPDGHDEIITIRVKEWGTPTTDMGREYIMPNSKAYYKVKYYGIYTLIPLEGLEAKRVCS